MILIELGYQKYLLPDEALALCKGIIKVEYKHVGNKSKYYVEENQPDIDIKFIQDSQIVYPNDTQTIEKDTKELLKVAESEKAERYKWYQDEKKRADALEAEVKALKALCPTSHVKENTDESNNS